MRIFSHFFKVAVGAFVASSALAFGQYNDDCCYPDCCQEGGLLDGIEIGAEFLYWQPFFDDLDFGFVSTSTPFSGSSSSSSSSGDDVSGRFHNLNHDWIPAFRVFAALKNDMCCGLNLCLAYTRVEDSRKRHLYAPTGGVLSSTLFHPVLTDLFPGFVASELTGHHRFNYDTYDLMFSHDFCFAECHQFTPYFGVTGMDLDRNRHSHLLAIDPSTGYSVDGHFKYQSDFWGIGLKVGNEYKYQIFDSLSIFGNGNLSILAGNVQAHNHQYFSESSPAGAVVTSDYFSFKTRDDWRLVPGYQLCAGFRYDTSICDWGITATIAYEFTQWFNLPRVPRFVSATPGAVAISTSDRGEHIGFQGLNVGLALKF